MKHFFYTMMLLLASMSNGSAQSRAQDSLALVDLYNATNGTSWRVKTNWLVRGQPIQNWYGITTNAQGLVTQIILNSNGLKDSLPNLNLPQLNTLMLISNQLTGSIPNFNLPNLRTLALALNQLSGSIPNFNNLLNLNVLSLADNQLSSSIPNFNMPRLNQLNLSNNQLTGIMPNLTLPSLQSFAFHKNRMDSLPRLAGLMTSGSFGMKGDTNRLTFDDILPNLILGLTYTKQDSIFHDTTIFRPVAACSPQPPRSACIEFPREVRAVF